jgi:SSS family solute:Na+ symporter
LVAWIFATLLAAVLSSFAMAAMACATMFTMDIYKAFFHPEAGEAEERRVTRLAVVVLALSATLIGAYMPPIIVAAINWLFAWMTPVFWMVIFGLFWRRSAKAAVVTFLVTWVLNTLWSFTGLPAALGAESLPNVYITLVSALLVGVSTLMFFDAEPGYFRRRETGTPLAQG